MESRFCPRTILVIKYVVAVALILVYRTVQPPPIPAPTPPGGRYQLESVGTSEPFLLDTLTGETYTADTSVGPRFWRKAAEPISPSVKAPANRKVVVNGTAWRP